MNFSYQNYVNRMKYQPYQWPPDVALAELHSRCSQPGPPNPLGVKCPCCDFPIKQKMKGWYNRNIYQDFKDAGAGIPAYFGLLRFYNLVVVLILLINTAYPLYATAYTCNNYNNYDNPLTSICVIVGPFKYIAFKSLDNTLSNNGHSEMVDVLEGLQTVVFYVLLISNNLSLFYLVYIEDKCKKNKKSQQKYLSLLIEDLPPDTTEQKLIEKLTFKNVKPKIKSITFIKQIKNFHYLFRKRIKAYFQIKALLIQNINPKMETQMNQNLIKLNQEYKKYKGVYELPSNKALVIFQSRQQLNQVHKTLKISQSYSWYIGLINIFKTDQNKIQRYQTFTSKMPELQQVLWINLGQNHTTRMVAKVKTLIIFFVLLIICYSLFYYPLKITLTSHSKTAENADLTTMQKIIPSIIGIMMLIISISFRDYMVVLSQRRNPKTYLQRANFILLTTIMFHLLFYIMIPTFFFVFNNGINPSVKLYTISEQARTFIMVQLVLSFIDLGYRIWSTRKVLSLSDQRESFKFPQKFLHQIVQFKQFPLQFKLIIMFKLWSFVLFYSFFLPYITFIISLAMGVLYFLQKKNVYVHYTQRRYLGIQLQLNFLNIYINFFCIYECLIYCLNVHSTWQIILAIFSTFFSLLVQFIYWKIIQKKKEKKKEKKLALIKKLTNNEIAESNKIKQQLLKEFNQIQTEDDQTYAQVYKQFLEQYNQPEVDAQIQTYIETLNQKFRQSGQNGERKSVTEIQMTDENQYRRVQ